MKRQYNIKYSSFIAHRYHYFSAQSPNTLKHFPHLGTSLKIPVC